MSKRNPDVYKECLLAVGRALKKDVDANLKFWARHKPDEAVSRQAAYESVIFTIKEALKKEGLHPSDMALEDYDVPKVIK